MSRASAVVVGVLAIVLVAAGFAFSHFVLAPAFRTTATPTTVTARFFDGVNNGDTRQACAQLVRKNRGSLPRCELGYIVILGQLAFFYGKVPHYQVVGHSVKTWSQEYRGRSVRLAVVSVTVRGDRSSLLHVWLRLTPAGWRIYRFQNT